MIEQKLGARELNQYLIPLWPVVSVGNQIFDDGPIRFLSYKTDIRFEKRSLNLNPADGNAPIQSDRTEMNNRVSPTSLGLYVCRQAGR